jgi:hypothetical protein
MSLHGKEKIWYLVNRLEKARDTTAKGEPIGLHLANDLNNHYSLHDLETLSKRLDQDNVVRYVGVPANDNNHKAQFELLPGFDPYFAKLEEDSEYCEWCGKKPKRKLALGDATMAAAQAKDALGTTIAESARAMHESVAAIQRGGINTLIGSASTQMDDIVKAARKQFPPAIMSEPAVPAFIPRNYDAENNTLLHRIADGQRISELTPQRESIAHEITFTSSREIVLDGMYQLTRPRFDSENEQVFTYLYAHPNETFNKKQIEEALSLKLQKTFAKIIENLGFHGDLARLFFDQSKTSIRFRKSVTVAELRAMNITLINLNHHTREK